MCKSVVYLHNFKQLKNKTMNTKTQTQKAENILNIIYLFSFPIAAIIYFINL